MEKIAVTQKKKGPIAFRLHLFQGPARERRPAVEAMWEVERKLQLPCESHTITQDESKRGTLSVEQKESGVEERGRESERKSETSCLEVPRLYDAAAAHAHNPCSGLATIKRSICLYRNIGDVQPRSIFEGRGGSGCVGVGGKWAWLPSSICAFKIYMRCSWCRQQRPPFNSFLSWGGREQCAHIKPDSHHAVQVQL